MLTGASIAVCGFESFLSKVSAITNINFHRFEKRLIFHAASGDNNIRAQYLVVAFSGGALKMGGMPREEFKRTLQNIDDCDHLFLIDPLQSWYLNDPDRHWTGIEWYSKELKQHTEKYPGKVLFIGNCMGATGCLLLSNLAQTCLLFNPLINTRKDPSFVRRSYQRFFVPKLKVDELEATIEANLKLCPRIVSHFSTVKQYFWHRQFLPDTENIHVIIHDIEEGLVGYLKKKNEIVRLIRAELDLM